MSQMTIAAQHLAARGPVPLEDLARATGVSRATLYRRYGSARGVAAALRAEGVELPDTASRIFDALLQVIERGGYSALSLDEVARVAGVSPATLYRRYRNRPGLLKAFVRARSARSAARVELSTDDPPADVLRRVAELVMRGDEQNAAMIRAGLAATPAERAILQRIRDPGRGTEAALTRYFAQLARRGRVASTHVPAFLARSFLVLLLGEAGVFEPDRRKGPLGARASAAVALFWQGAKAK